MGDLGCGFCVTMSFHFTFILFEGKRTQELCLKSVVLKLGVQEHVKTRGVLRRRELSGILEAPKIVVCSIGTTKITRHNHPGIINL